MNKAIYLVPTYADILRTNDISESDFSQELEKIMESINKYDTKETLD